MPPPRRPTVTCTEDPSSTATQVKIKYTWQIENADRAVVEWSIPPQGGTATTNSIEVTSDGSRIEDGPRGCRTEVKITSYKGSVTSTHRAECEFPVPPPVPSVTPIRATENIFDQFDGYGTTISWGAVEGAISYEYRYAWQDDSLSDWRSISLTSVGFGGLTYPGASTIRFSGEVRTVMSGAKSAPATVAASRMPYESLMAPSVTVGSIGIKLDGGSAHWILGNSELGGCGRRGVIQVSERLADKGHSSLWAGVDLDHIDLGNFRYRPARG